MRLSSLTLFVLLAFVFVTACSKQEEADDDTQQSASEQTAADTEVPAAAKDLSPEVFAAFTASYPGAEITGTEQETEDGQTYYKVTCTHNGANMDVIYMADGTMLGEQREISAVDMPDIVAAAVQKEAPGAPILKAERISTPDITAFEVVVDKGKDGKVKLQIGDRGIVTGRQKVTDVD